MGRGKKRRVTRKLLRATTRSKRSRFVHRGGKRVRLQAPKTKDDLVKHFLKRAKERYELELTLSDVEAINRQVMNGDLLIVKRSSQNRTLYLLPWLDQKVLIAYNHNLNSVCTALPKSKLDNLPNLEVSKADDFLTLAKVDFDTVLTVDEVNNINATIQKKFVDGYRVKSVKKISNTRHEYLVFWSRYKMQVVYSSKQKCVIYPTSRKVEAHD